MSGMKISVLCVALAVLLVGFASGSREEPVAWSIDELDVQPKPVPLPDAEVKAAIAATKMDCPTCERYMELFAVLGQSNTTMEALDEYLQGKCQEINKSGLEHVCDVIVNFLTTVILPVLAKKVYAPPYSPQAFCAFVNICIIDCCVDDVAPEQVHISLTNDSSTMAVTWVTQNPTDSIVLWGMSSSNQAYKAEGLTHTYLNGGWNGTIHTAVMTGLVPNSRYYYKVGDGSTFSKVFTFRTLPSYNGTGTETRPLVFAVIGDMGLTNANETIAALINGVAQEQIDVILHIGDISYADGAQQRWDEYLRTIEPFAAQAPYMVIPGNHEIAFDFASYRNRFFMPDSAFGGAQLSGVMDNIGNMFWSVNVGPVHVLGISTESPLDLPWVDPTGLDFVKADLAAANQNRQAQPWIVALGHRPMYCSSDSENCKYFSAYLNWKLEEVFNQQHVDLFLSGHVHNYERTYPVYKNQPTQTNYINPTAMVQIINGAAGNREGLQGFHSPFPDWSVSRIQEYGFGLMQVQNGSMLHWEFVLDADMTIGDEFTIIRN